MTDRLTILQGDCLDKLRELPDASVQCVVTSPPYGNLRTYDGHCKWNFEESAKELFRVLCPGGILCWNVGDEVIKGGESLTPFRQGIYFVDSCGFKMHDRMIWEKLNFSHPEITRYHHVFEDVFILSKGKPRCFNPIMDKKNSTSGRIGAFGENTYMKRDGSKSTRHTYVTQEYGMRGNVWKGLTAGQENVCSKLEHPAMMPKWLAHDLILSFSNLGDTVLDPFAGSGTTGIAALQLGRKAILIELNPSYIELIKRRCDVTPISGRGKNNQSLKTHNSKLF